MSYKKPWGISGSVEYLSTFGDGLVDDEAALLQVLFHRRCRGDLTNSL